MRNRVTHLLAVALGLGMACPTWAEIPASPPLHEQLLLAVQAMQVEGIGLRSGKLEDLELFVLAEIAAALDKPDHALSFRQYIKDYLTDSPLVSLLPDSKIEVGPPSIFDPDPDYSRMIKSAYAFISQQVPGPEDPELNALAVLLEENVRDAMTRMESNGYRRFLQAHPESLYAGWAAYQLAWVDWKQREGDNRALTDFGRQHPKHPLSPEALSTLNVRYFDPRQMAQRSSVIPGMGEETLEPGMREASSALYSELLYLGATIGFALAAQNGYRSGNLTGALIFANLLILNHRGSADKAYYLALRRNQAEYRKFMLDHLEVPITGSGSFVAPTPPPVPPAPPLAEDLILSLVYQFRSVGDSLQGKRLVLSEELGNLGFRAEYFRSLIEFESEGPVTSGLGVAPFGRVFFNEARSVSNDLHPGGLQVQELEGGVEAVWFTRLHSGPNWFQLRLSGGPSWRDRRWTFVNDQYTEQGLAYALSGGLAWASISGVSWQIHMFYSTTAERHTAQLEGQEIGVPPESMGVQFGLGVRF